MITDQSSVEDGRLHSKKYSAPDTLYSESWINFNGVVEENKKYHVESGSIKEHWVNNGFKIIDTEYTEPSYDEAGNYIGEVPRKRSVRIATRRTYDVDGNLLKSEYLEDGIPVD